MKYLEFSALESLTSFLTNKEIGGCILNGRVEAFSCKRAGDDKKLSKVLEAKFADDLAAVAPAQRTRSTSLGDLNEGSTRRLLIDLISTLNASFPDYDFSHASPDSFSQKELKNVIKDVNTCLAELTSANPTFLSELWSVIDEVIQIKNCEVYSYLPDMEEDPFSDGTMWSFNFFFFNKELKRICYFTCLATSVFYQDGIAMDDDDDEIGVEASRDDSGDDYEPEEDDDRQSTDMDVY